MTMKVLQEQSVIVDQLKFQGGHMRVIRGIKGFGGNSGRGQKRHILGVCKAVVEDREKVIGDRERVKEWDYKAWRQVGARSSRGQGSIKEDRESLEGTMVGVR